MTLETIIGIGASVLTAVSAIPQVIKLIKEKKAEDVSLLMFFVLLAGLGLWIYYGFLKEDWILICSNSFSFLINLTVVILTLKYKKKF